MVQKNIRDWDGIPYTNVEANELTQELNDRTVSPQEGYNSVDELASKMKSAETNINLKEDKSDKGTANGYAELGADGKVPSAQLPASVDEVQEYANLAAFPATGSSSVIYVALDTNKTYRWGGTTYVEIASGNLVLGETSTTAYRGDRGKVAYDHSLTAHAPSDAEANQSDAEILAQFSANADANVLTDTLLTKLNQIEDNATADQTDAEIRTAVDAATNSNVFTDTDKSNLDGLQSGDSNNAKLDAANVFSLAGNRFVEGIEIGGASSNYIVEDGANFKLITGNHMVFEAAGNGATVFDFKGGGASSLQTDNVGANWYLPATSTAILDGESATSKMIPTVEWTSATFGAKSDVTTNTSDITDRLKSVTVGEPTGSDIVINMVSLTQAEYDAGTPSLTTFYVITDA